jgi:hypothetical protein
MSKRYSAIFGCIFFLISCKKSTPPPPEDYLLFRWIQFNVIDSVSNQSLIGKSGERYHPDSIKIYSIGDGPTATGKVVFDSIGNKYKGGIGYLEAILPSADYVSPLLFRSTVYVRLNYTDIDTFYIDKQSGLGFSFYLNNRFLITTPPLDQNIPTFYLKK